MILNERQYRQTKAAVTDFENRLRDLEHGDLRKRVSPDKRTVLADAAKSQLADLRREIEEYEAFRAGAIPITPVQSLGQLPLALIRARIARGWTQVQLADALKVSEQQVQRDESNRYGGASLDRLRQIADVLGVRVAGAAALTGDASQSFRSDPRWRLPILVMLVHLVRKTHRRAVSGRLELQKLCLLAEERLRRELSWSVFSFVPYLYGAYELSLEDDVDFLVKKGVFAAGDARKGRDDLAESRPGRSRLETTDRGTAWLNTFLRNEKLADPETKLSVYRIAETVATEFGGLGPDALIDHTYERHPALSRRSVIRNKVRARRQGNKRQP